MEREDKYTESGSQYDNQLEKLKFEDMDLLYENFPSDNLKRSLTDYFGSLGAFLKFLYTDIDHSTALLDNLLMHIKNNGDSNDIDILLNAANEESRTINNLIITLQNFFEDKADLELETVKFNSVMNDILVRLAEYTESKNISIFKKFGSDVSVRIDKEQLYLACFHIIKSWCENISGNGKIFITSKENNNRIEIEFRDNDTGIPDNILKYIFEPSNPLEHEWEFDLVLANKIIKDHSGKISVNHSEKLNTLIITLPVTSENEFNNLINERII